MSDGAEDDQQTKPTGGAGVDRVSADIEERKLSLEERKLQEDVALRKLTLELQAKELAHKQKEARWGRLTNPLFVAIVVTSLTVLAGIFTQYETLHEQRASDERKYAQQTASDEKKHLQSVEADERKHKLEMETEELRAEASRITETVKTGGSDQVACSLSFLVNIGLITKSEWRSSITSYLLARPGGSGIGAGAPSSGCSAKVAAGSVQPSVVLRWPQTPSNWPKSVPVQPSFGSWETTDPKQGKSPVILSYQLPGTGDSWTWSRSGGDKKVTYDTGPGPEKPVEWLFPPGDTKESPAPFLYATGWIGAGHSQIEACEQGIKENQAKYPGKVLGRIGSSEETRRAPSGQVDYKYSCTIAATDPPAMKR